MICDGTGPAPTLPSHTELASTTSLPRQAVTTPLMPNASAIASLGLTLEKLLGDAFADPAQPPPVPGRVTTAVLTRAEDFDVTTSPRIARPCLSILLVRVSVSTALRTATLALRTIPSGTVTAPALPLELQYLLTPWADTAADELPILGRTLQCLHSAPVLSGTLLQSGGGWSSTDHVDLSIDDVSPELLDSMVQGVFSALPVRFKLSVLCRARPVRIDAQHTPGNSPTTS